MSTPKKYYGDDNANDDASGDYAEKRGYLLEFTDARNNGNYISFIAFLTSFSQNFTSNWGTEEVMGRMDPIATFKNTTRTVNISWDLPATDVWTAVDNLGRCNQLVNMMYPSYVKQGESELNALAMSKPPMIRLRYANLIEGPEQEGLLGFITNCDWTPILEMGYFSLSVLVGEPEIYPKVISLSMQFQVIHEQELGWDENNEKLGDTSFPFPGADDIVFSSDEEE